MRPANFFRITFAREFCTREHQVYDYEKNRIERFGQMLHSIVGIPLDISLREIKNPVTIIGLTAIAMMCTTIVYYPEIFVRTITQVAPILWSIKPWMVKFALYILIQTTILGNGIRAFGRFSNRALMQAWDANELNALYPGSKKI